jgi:anti-anti-sigma factor
MLSVTFKPIAEAGCCDVVHLAGALTRTQVPTLRDTLARHFAKPDHLIVDVSKVTVIDWNGLRGLLHARILVDGKLALVSPPLVMMKLLEGTGLVRTFPTFSSAEEARLLFHPAEVAAVNG